NNHGHLAPDEIGRQRRQLIVVTIGPAILDQCIAALDITGLAQALPEGGDRTGILGGRCTVEESDHRDPRLLRPRRKRPRRRAAEERDELAPQNHSITSSARSRIDGGMARPSAVAALRFTSISNSVGSCTGRSPGFSPRRMRSTYGAARRQMSPRSAP